MMTRPVAAVAAPACVPVAAVAQTAQTQVVVEEAATHHSQNGALNPRKLGYDSQAGPASSTPLLDQLFSLSSSSGQQAAPSSGSLPGGTSFPPPFFFFFFFYSYTAAGTDAPSAE